jgi:hypothetical protein
MFPSAYEAFVYTSDLQEGRFMRGHLVITGSSKIGKDPQQSDVILADPYISRLHCEIERTPDGYRLIDQASTNGTFVNGKRIVPYTPVLLQDDETFQVGDFTLYCCAGALYYASESDLAENRTPSAYAGIDDRYRIGEQMLAPTQLLKVTDVGSVFRAIVTANGEEVAYKRLAPAFADHASITEAAQRAVECVAAADPHPNVVSVRKVDLRHEPSVVISDFVDSGRSLEHELAKISKPWPLEEALQLIREIAAALEHIHKATGLAHGDLRPGTILRDREGRTRVTGFALAATIRDTVATLPDTPRFIGHPLYTELKGKVLQCLARRRLFSRGDRLSSAYRPTAVYGNKP